MKDLYLDPNLDCCDPSTRNEIRGFTDRNLAWNKLAESPISPSRTDRLPLIRSEESSESVDPHLAQMRLLSIQGKYDAALAEAQAALDVAADYNREDCLVARAYMYVRLNRLDEATAEFEKLTEPKTSEDLFKVVSISDEGLLGLSELAIARKTYDEALTLLDRWANNGPGAGWGYVLRAQVYSAQNQPDKARVDLELARTLILYPDEVVAAERLQQQIGGS